MATNIEEIFRDFVVNKMKEIADETEDNSRIDEPNSEPAAESRQDGLETEQVNTPTAADKETCNDLQGDCGIEANSTKHRKNKKHKKHKSKKKKKRKEEKECGTEGQSDKETQDSGKKKKKRKKKKKSKEADKAKLSGSRSNSSASGSESESESKPSSKNAKLSSADKTSKSELKIAAVLGTSPLPDIIPGIENSVHTSAEDKKRSPSRSSKREQSSKGRRTRSRSPRQKSRHRSRSRSSKRHGRSTSLSRNGPTKRHHQQREKSRTPSWRRNNRSRSRSVRRRKYSRSRSRSRRSRSRSGLTSRKNRRSASKSRSRSRSKSGSRTKHSKSRSKSVSKDKQKEVDLVENKTVETVDNSETSAISTDVSQKSTENGKSPTLAMNLDTKLPETVVNSAPKAPVVTGSWRPIPFLGESKSENQFSQKCITPEVPLEAIEEPADTSTDIPKDSECVLNPEEKETPASSKPEIQTSIEIDSKSPSKSPSQQRSTKSILPVRSRSKSILKKSRSSSRNDDKKSKSRSPSEKKKYKSKAKHKRSKSKSPKRRRSRSPSPSRRKRSRTPDRSRRSKSRRRSRSRSKRRSRSGSRWRRGFGSRSINQRDRWKREPSRSPVLILRKKRSTSRTRRSTSKTPPRLTELDKEQLLEIAKANAAAMCAKAGVPIPESLRPKNILQLPFSNPNSYSGSLALGVPLMTMNVAMASMTAATMTAALSSIGALASMPQFAPLPTIVNKPPSSSTSNLASIEEAKRKVTKQANNFSIKELTERCKKITENKEEMAIAKPHVSDDEDDEQSFGAGALKETKGIAFSIGNTSVKAGVRTEATFAKEFPVSSGSQHRKKEADGAYGEWVPVEKKKTEKPSASGPAGTEESSKENDSVFPEAPSQPVDITVAVSDRAVAQKRLAENPFDINAMCMLNRAQEQVDAWAQSNTIPGLFTGSTGAQVLSSEELSNSGLQAWIKKDQFLRAAPVSGGMGEFLMRKMGWRAGEGLGKHREGTVEPIIIDFKTDRKGLVAEGEKTQKSGNLVVMKDLLGKHPVSALMEMCNKKKWPQPEFIMVHHSGPDHRKNFLFKKRFVGAERSPDSSNTSGSSNTADSAHQVVVNGNDYQPQTASPNKKHAKAMAATVALQAMGEVAGEGVHTGPVFTAATTV
ncbi:Protein SON [Triplophysa tibetana]|uniref:Protein SON n=1 Tax=Triplophysa tibetana TaxID=1572043 RepID=A0A5A9PLG3_9TELE|nr:Protein SON [Triplophysa tibetana]